MARTHRRTSPTLLAGAEHAVVLTGAGVSTESGIPDFRSRGGTWTETDPMKVATLSMFLTRAGALLVASTARASTCSAGATPTRPTRRWPSWSAAGS